MLKKFFLPFLVLITFALVLNWPVIIKGLIPFPGDLLVSFYFPWNSGSFFGFDPWTTHKEVIAADAIRQIYPWKELVIDQLKSNHWPLWNPYNFSGTPLLANLQSSVFSPVNFVFFLLPFLWAWLSLVIFLPVVFGFGFYLFLKSLKLSSLSALFGALVAMNISYITIWEEQLIHIQSILFLPFILLTINLCATKKNYRLLLLVPMLLAMSLFGGHVQTVVYVSLLTFLFGLYKKIPLKWLIFCFAVFPLAAAVQLLPTVELFVRSARDGAETMRLFPQTIIPLSSYATVLIPDFFGNPASGNFWGIDYSNFELFFGTAAAFLGFVGLLTSWQKSIVKFFAAVLLLGLIFSSTPLAFMWPFLHIPVLSSSNASRIILLSFVSCAVLAGFGLETLLYYAKQNRKKLIFASVLFLFIFLCEVASSIFQTPEIRATILRNSVLPGLVLGCVIFIALTRSFLSKSKTFLIISAFLIFAASLFEYTAFYTKYQPFSNPAFVFPNHPVFSFLKKQPGHNRFFGFGTAYVETNFSSHFKVFAPEGYDSLYIKKYGQLLASTDGKVFPESVMRSDAYVGKADNKNRNKLFDILGIKYILDKDDLGTGADLIQDTGKFSKATYKIVWHHGKFSAYKRLTALPRAKIFYDYEVIADPKEAATRVFSSNFDHAKVVTLAHDPHTAKSKIATGGAKITSYKPGVVTLTTNSSAPGILFLSDVNYPGWHASVDGKKTTIFDADVVFRGIVIPQGHHKVNFVYQPISFTLGLTISVVTWLLLFLAYAFFKPKTTA